MKNRMRVTAVAVGFCVFLSACFVIMAFAFSFAGCAKTQSTVNVQSNFDADSYYERLEHCVEQIREKTDFVPDFALVLGTGLGSLGADTIGMSTVVEVIAARQMGMRVCVISNVTSMAAGLQDKISHEEVQSASDQAVENLNVLISGLLSRIT